MIPVGKKLFNRTLYLKRLQRLRLYRRLFRLNRRIAAHSHPDQREKSVVFFNASARLEGLNQNAAFSLLASWGVQLAGREVIHFACRSGMSHCVLGAGLGDPTAPPPCRGCIADTRWFTGAAPSEWFEFQEDPPLRSLIEELPVQELQEFYYQNRPLGQLVLPSLRWILRRHHLRDDRLTRYLYREFILSAHNVAEKFSALLKRHEPAVVVVFNGLQYPEAVVRREAKQRQIRVITHEVNLRPFSAFFTEGQATIYPMNIPDSFQLNENQQSKLDSYLEKRFQGDFTMAGIKFWSEINQLPDWFIQKINQYQAVVPVFTNVIFDTSQAHANTIFTDMFAWLERVLEAAARHPETLFVIRAHPDEIREGKRSQETVSSWVDAHGIAHLPNVIFIAPDESFSSYELIRRSKFTLVYNSSIGLEATLLGCPVLCAGRARYTQYPTVFYPQSLPAYTKQLEELLTVESIELPEEHLRNARRFLYFQLFRASLSFEDFLTDHVTPGYVQLKNFPWRKLQPGETAVIDCLVKGILDGDEFVLEKDQE